MKAGSDAGKRFHCNWNKSPLQIESRLFFKRNTQSDKIKKIEPTSLSLIRPLSYFHSWDIELRLQTHKREVMERNDLLLAFSFLVLSLFYEEISIIGLWAKRGQGRLVFSKTTKVAKTKKVSKRKKRLEKCGDKILNEMLTKTFSFNYVSWL